MEPTYKKYFDIDPEFFPAVNIDLIQKDKNLWRKFYPHETFVELLKQTLSVLERKQKLNIWVEGAYGTGKSHAVLTLKHLLDASEAEVTEYFHEFNLDEDLCKRFIAAKSRGKIVTVHRWGSSSIHSDNDLFLAIQEEIENALKEAGIENAGPNAIKEGVIKYLSDEENKRSFEVYVKGSYRELFNGESVDDILNELRQYTDQALQALMGKIFKVGNEKNIRVFSLDDALMKRWIEEVIRENDLKALIFIWDEFSEYFSNNAHRLTGFQRILELSETAPFCFIPVTHRSDAGLSDDDNDKKKIKGRFINPSCIIQLPENMAFKLMGKAMQKKDDEVIKKEWDDILTDLETRTTDSRKRIKEYAKIGDSELRGILPIHPYAACLLKHISASFQSNQRSMFDFIKNGGNEQLNGFQWFISERGPLDEDNPFLTIDLLWGFFYDNGKGDLSHNIRLILDRYQNLSNQLENDEKRVLKAILLFQAMSQNANDAVEIFLPNEKNLNLAFEGTDLDRGQAAKCAEKLIKDKVIYKKTLKNGDFLYSVLTGELDSNQIEQYKHTFETKTTSTIIKENSLTEKENSLTNIIDIPFDLQLRFKVDYAGTSDFEQVARKAINKAEDDNRHFYVVTTMTKDASESTAIAKKIKTMIDAYPDSEIIYVDCGKTPFGSENFAKWIEFMATAAYYQGKDNNEASTYKGYANSVLTQWRTNVRQGQFVLYTRTDKNGINVNSLDSLAEKLRDINQKRFPLGLECNFKSMTGWWQSNSLGVGVECGATLVIKGTYNNKNAKLDVALGEAWKEAQENQPYWEHNPSAPISRIKIGLESLIQKELTNNGRISIKTIYHHLTDTPSGFLPCNLTAFFMGFLLHEYAGNKYSWSDALSSDELTTDKLKEMIERVIKDDLTPDSRYRDNYIVTMTPEEKAFIEGTSVAFDIPKSQCSSIEATRDRVRNKMKTILFPIWTLQEILDEIPLQSDKDTVSELIQNYQDLANNMLSKSDSDIANSIGKAYLKSQSVAKDLRMLFTQEYCKKGMLKYLNAYRDGILPTLAKEIQDQGQYINCLKQKIDNVAAANWVWKKETLNSQIDVVILEYEITKETGTIIGSQCQYQSAISAWNEKVGNLRFSYETIKHYVGSVEPLLSMLNEIKKQGTLADNKKQPFLETLRNYGKEFNSFYQQQLDIFKQSCNFYLQDLSDTDKEKVFMKMPSGCFVDDNATFCKKVEDTVAKYRKDLGSIQIKTIWKEKTGTETPYAWSKQYKMPILSMISCDDITEYRTLFSTLNSPNPCEKEVEKALHTLEYFKYWDELGNPSKRDEAFIKILLKDNSTLLKNVEEVKNYLESHISDEPYHWLDSVAVEQAIVQLAESKYFSEGYQEAIKRIDSLNSEDVKNYLKELIKNNMNIGVQIIRSN